MNAPHSADTARAPATRSSSTCGVPARALSQCETCAGVDGATATGTRQETEGRAPRKAGTAAMEARRVETVSARVDATDPAPGRTAVARFSLPFRRLPLAPGRHTERRHAKLPV